MRLFDLHFLHSLLLALTSLLFLGCGNSDKPNETLRGLQEENKVLREQIKLLEGNKSDRDAESLVQIEKLKKAHDEFLTRERELHRKAAAQLEKDISSLRLELGAVQREKIALQEFADREPRIKDANATRIGTDVWVMALLLGITIIMLFFVVFRYRSTSDRLNLLTMQQVSELRRIGGIV